MDNKKMIDEISGKSINFLIGSGASVGAIPTLWIKSFSKSFEDIMTSKDYTVKQKKVLFYLWFIYWVRKTKIDETTETNKKILDEYTTFINSLVRIANNEGYDKHKRVNVFTTNYDTFFELAFDKASVTNRLSYFNDGSRGFINKYISTEDFYINVNHSGVNDGFQRTIPTINLIKLHGSVTWKKEENRIKVDINSELFNNLIQFSNEIDGKITELLVGNSVEQSIASSFSINKIEEYLSNTTLTEEDLVGKATYLVDNHFQMFEDFYKNYKDLPIINPTNKKFSETVFEQHYYQMLRLLSFELERKNSVLIVFGFSFSDEHIFEIVKRSIVNPNLKIYIVSFDKKSQDRVKEKFGDEYRIEFIPDFNKSIPGSTLLGNFIYFNSLFKGGGK